MWRITRRLSETSQAHGTQILNIRNVNKCRLMCTQAAKQESKSSETSEESAPPPPPPPPPKSGFLWKFLGATIVGAGGVVGYAWYDAEFRNKLEDYVPYSKEALNYVFQYLPSEQQQVPQVQPIQKFPDLKTPATPEVKKAKEPEVVHEEKLPVIVEDPKQAKLRKQKEEEEKKRLEQEKAKLALQRREEEEAAQNKELEFIVDRLLVESKKSVENAVVSQKAAAKAIAEHTKKLKQAMETTGSESEWGAVMDTHQSRTDAVWSSDTVTERAKLHLEKLHSIITDGKANKVTKKKKVPTATLR